MYYTKAQKIIAKFTLTTKRTFSATHKSIMLDNSVIINYSILTTEKELIQQLNEVI